MLLFITLLLCTCSLKTGRSALCSTLNDSEISCTSREEAVNNSIIYSGCEDFLGQPNTFIFLKDYQCLSNNLHLLEAALENTATSEYCNHLLRSYVCSYVYPDCDPLTNQPLGICQQECMEFLFGDECKTEINFLIGISDSITQFNFHRQCDNTLAFLRDSGLNIPDTGDNQDQCVNVSDVITATRNPPQPSSTSTTITTTTITTITLLVEQPTVNFPVILPTSISAALILLCLLISAVMIYIKIKQRRHENRSSSMPLNQYDTNSYGLHEITHNYDEVHLFQLSFEDVENQNLREAVIPFEMLEITDEIGQGAFGCVYKGIYTKEHNSGQKEKVEVAVKTIKNSTGSYNELKGFIEESSIMCNFDHPHVLGMVGICLDENNSPYLLLPFMLNGDLRNFLKKKREVGTSSATYPQGLSERMLLRMCSEIASGMEYLAFKKLVHRDLAARNCMVDSEIRVKIADFGLTRDIYQTDYYRQHQQSKIPVKWMAPESLYDRISNQKTDVWSFGVTCWEVFSLGRTPYPTISNAAMLEHLEAGHRLKQPIICPNSVYKLMLQCWEIIPEERPTFTEIYHTFRTAILPDGQSLREHQEDFLNNSDNRSRDDETTEKKSLSLHSFEQDSLFNSIVSLLPACQVDCSSKLEEEDSLVRTASEGYHSSDYYTDMHPITKFREKRKAKLQLEERRGSLESCHMYENHVTSHMTNSDLSVVHARQTSNTSNYITMNQAEPAKPKKLFDEPAKPENLVYYDQPAEEPGDLVHYDEPPEEPVENHIYYDEPPDEPVENHIYYDEPPDEPVDSLTCYDEPSDEPLDDYITMSPTKRAKPHKAVKLARRAKMILESAQPTTRYTSEGPIMSKSLDSVRITTSKASNQARASNTSNQARAIISRPVTSNASNPGASNTSNQARISTSHTSRPATSNAPNPARASNTSNQARGNTSNSSRPATSPARASNASRPATSNASNPARASNASRPATSNASNPPRASNASRQATSNASNPARASNASNQANKLVDLTNNYYVITYLPSR